MSKLEEIRGRFEVGDSQKEDVVPLLEIIDKQAKALEISTRLIQNFSLDKFYIAKPPKDGKPGETHPCIWFQARAVEALAAIQEVLYG
jgi:hypothetical protein